MNVLDGLVLLMNALGTATTLETVYSKVKDFYGGSLSVKEEHFVKKMHCFLEGYYSETTRSDEVVSQVKSDYEANIDMDMILRRVIIAIDRMDYEIKARWIARLFRAWEMGWIRFDQFEDMLKIIECWFLSDAKTLDAYHMKHQQLVQGDKLLNQSYRLEWYRMGRLTSLGLIAEHSPTKRDHNGINAYLFNPDDRYQITMWGNIMQRLIKNETLEDEWYKSTMESGVTQIASSEI